MAAAPRRGLFILFEGLDRCGKSTQCGLLHDYLVKNGHNTKRISFPDRSSPITGGVLNAYLQKKAAVDPHGVHLLFSANRWEKNEEMRQWVADGHMLVVDRYAYSGIAYSVAKKAVSLEWALHPDRGLMAPDLIFFFSLQFSEVQKRAGFGDEIFDNEEFQREVDGVYRTLQTRSPHRWRIIDASRSIEEIHAEIVSIIESSKDALSQSPIESLE